MAQTRFKMRIAGYMVIDAEDVDDDGEILNEVKAASRELYNAECQAIAGADDLSDA